MPTPREPHKLKNGAEAHVLTDDERRKGALAAAQKRRELGMSLREKVAQELDEHAAALVAAAVEKGEGGDWQAFLALWKQTHGQPPVEVTGEDGDPIRLEVSDARRRFESRLAELAERAGEEPAPS